MFSFDRLTTTGKSAVAEPCGKNPKDRDFVVDAGEEWVINSEVGYKWEPTLAPDRVSGLGAVLGDCLS
jgi:hypothetical protein